METEETKLWRAVLDRAIRDLNEPTIRADAISWFLDNRSFEGSFVFVAETLDMHPDFIRRKLFPYRLAA